MPRRPAFNAASLYVHFQPAMTRTYPVPGDLPGAMQDCLARLASSDGSVAARLAALRQLVDDDLRRPARVN